VPLYQLLHVSSNELGRPITLLSRPEGLPHSVPPPRRRRTGSVWAALAGNRSRAGADRI